MKDIFSNPTFWAAVSALIMLIALSFSNTASAESLKMLHYGELDRMYLDLLRIAIEKPHLRDPNAARTDDQRKEYDTYAYSVWNFLETIYDRCKRDKGLRSTWYPVIVAENLLHRKWFDDPGNRHKFKGVFHQFIRSKRFMRFVNDLDRMCLDLLMIATEKPHVRDPSAARTGDDKTEYDIYACLVWEFLEAIYDRCERDKGLRSTWYPVVEAESRLHRAWFDDPANKNKLKESFRKFIRSASFSEFVKTSRYGELGTKYFDQLRTAIEKPNVRDPNATRTDDQRIERSEDGV